jgi:hypothetical protein
MDEIVLEHAGIDVDVPVTRNFPDIAPEDAVAVATALAQVITVMPDLAAIDAVIQKALVSLGITDPAEVLQKLHDEQGAQDAKPAAKPGQPVDQVAEVNRQVARALKVIKEALIKKAETKRGQLK